MNHTFNLLRDTVDRFRSSEPIYSITLEYPGPFPRRYVAYGIGEAAVDALLEAGYMPRDISENLEFKDRIAWRAMQAIPDYHEILRARHKEAELLNAMTKRSDPNQLIDPQG